ncbi:hypothetical protein SAMN05660461_4368 [Chitinophaga ginsengisegetis]|uniref:Uncharacterized protein n=1 Tax=Chitinophaga ginsengisegetis TaxID=393003 RepID=A0A1T5P721_9BACT|nr:hypothetical protein [Chitinophaga ginsengisegetis]SKD08502.1 hypothetical protein SAMN05660461_4368 [Chitinophaga ginsengisegetis]
MTAIELKNKIEAVSKFTLQPPFEPIVFEFKDGHLYKDGKPLTKYSITEDSRTGHFRLNLNDVLKDGTRIFMYEYEDIIINIDGDDSFPVIVNYSNKDRRRQYVILQAHAE